MCVECTLRPDFRISIRETSIQHLWFVHDKPRKVNFDKFEILIKSFG